MRGTSTTRRAPDPRASGTAADNAARVPSNVVAMTWTIGSMSLPAGTRAHFESSDEEIRKSLTIDQDLSRAGLETMRDMTYPRTGSLDADTGPTRRPHRRFSCCGRRRDGGLHGGDSSQPDDDCPQLCGRHSSDRDGMGHCRI